MRDLLFISAVIIIILIVFLRHGISDLRKQDNVKQVAERSVATEPEIEGKRDFILKTDWESSEMPEAFMPGEVVDVNLGNTPQKNIQAVLFQLTGKLPPKEEVEKWMALLNENPKLRRIDIAVKMAESLGKTPRYEYSDPWQKQPRLLTAPDKRVKRELGAVCMYFFGCPGGVNGKMGWANNHAPGMDKPSEICKMNPEDSGYYNPENPGFWLMELLDARYAGLQFLLLNTYGPDLKGNALGSLNKALLQIDSMGLDKPIKIGLFDDTWTWGQPHFDDFWKQRPDMLNAEACAKTLFEAKWKPFFSAIPRKHWYLFKGRPLIYFYNSGTIQNRYNSAPVFKLMKKMFKDEYGVEPYLCSDDAFWGSDTENYADNRFKWYSLNKSADEASFKMNDVILAHSMVRWDSTARENKQVERAGKTSDKIYKDDVFLKRLLNETHDSDLVVIATWNDLGEGTGINRCYDYYWGGQWQRPTHFMELIRASQEGKMLTVETRK